MREAHGAAESKDPYTLNIARSAAGSSHYTIKWNVRAPTTVLVSPCAQAVFLRSENRELRTDNCLHPPTYIDIGKYLY